MVVVARPTGLIYLTHYENEAVRMGYDGLHQWNFTCADGRLIIWNRESRTDVAAAIGPSAHVQCDRSDNLIVTMIRRKQPLPPRERKHSESPR